MAPSFQMPGGIRASSAKRSACASLRVSCGSFDAAKTVIVYEGGVLASVVQVQADVGQLVHQRVPEGCLSGRIAV